jgi:hypothetical protein
VGKQLGHCKGTLMLKHNKRIKGNFKGLMAAEVSALFAILTLVPVMKDVGIVATLFL